MDTNFEISTRYVSDIDSVLKHICILQHVLYIKSDFYYMIINNKTLSVPL